MPLPSKIAVHLARFAAASANAASAASASVAAATSSSSSNAAAGAGAGLGVGVGLGAGSGAAGAKWHAGRGSYANYQVSCPPLLFFSSIQSRALTYVLSLVN